MDLPRLAPLLLVAAVALHPRAALAGPPEEARAAALFAEGRNAMKTKDYATACPKFAESLELDPAPGTRLNLALCRESLGQIARALEDFRMVAEVLPAKDARSALAKDKITQLDKRVPRLVIQLAPTTQPGAVVTVDEEPVDLAMLATPRLLEPGDHVVVVRAPGRQPRDYRVTLAEGDRRELAIELGLPKPQRAANAPAAAPDGAAAAPGLPWRTIGFVAGGVGVAGIAVGAITGAMVLSHKSTIEENCDARFCRSQEGIDAVSSAGTLSTVSTIGFVAGAVALAGGAVLVFADPFGETTRVAAVPAPGGGVLVATGTFR